KYGDDGWEGYWKKLKANGVKVVDGWEQAYNEEFSGSAGGKEAKADRPLVVSYASSPPAEVIYADPKPDTAPTGVAEGTCFRQVEYAGLLSNAANPEGGKALLDFLVSNEFQDDMPSWAPPAARRPRPTGRWWSPTPPRRPPRSSTRTPSRTPPPPAWPRAPASGRSSTRGCRAAPRTPRAGRRCSTSESARSSRTPWRSTS